MQEKGRFIGKKLLNGLKAGALFTGFALDGVNKLGQDGLLENPFPLGHGTFLENHIGNFGSSVLVAAVARPAIRYLEWSFDKELDPQLQDRLTFLVVAAANVYAEVIVKNPNPEMAGDIGVGLMAALVYLAWDPSRRQNVQVVAQS